MTEFSFLGELLRVAMLKKHMYKQTKLEKLCAVHPMPVCLNET